VRAALGAADGVEAVHHLHVWTMGSERSALSAHIVLTGPLSLHDAQERATELKGMLATRFGIQHTTLEVECHACVEDHVHVVPSEPARDAHHDH
jgi:cobalt-zinc-cadmium efflux system protein